MKKVKKVICNKSGLNYCEGCQHSIPHEKFGEIYHIRKMPVCTVWTRCFDGEGEISVRCETVKEEK